MKIRSKTGLNIFKAKLNVNNILNRKLKCELTSANSHTISSSILILLLLYYFLNSTWNRYFFKFYFEMDKH